MADTMTMRRILITAGPTREPIDRVRFISNRSSGQMGIAIAKQAADAGHQVTLLLGPVCQVPSSPPYQLERFETALDLETQLKKHWPNYDVLIMAAAVADYRPKQYQAGKIPRTQASSLELKLTAVPDLVAMIAKAKRADQRVIAFALEDASQLEERAFYKMNQKGVDAIVANPLETMDAHDIRAIWLTRQGRREPLASMNKQDFAQWLTAAIESLFA